jgi:hypothetical protein
MSKSLQISPLLVFIITLAFASAGSVRRPVERRKAHRFFRGNFI